MKRTSIERICNLPLELQQGGQSLKALLAQIQPENNLVKVTTEEIIQYLQKHPKLLNIWKQYSEDKRQQPDFITNLKMLALLEIHQLIERLILMPRHALNLLLMKFLFG